MKYVREGRFGPPKTFKTGSVVGTYPKPMLVIQFDPGGLEIIRDQNKIKWMTIDELKAFIVSKATPSTDITAVDLAFKPAFDLVTNYVPAQNKVSFEGIVAVANMLREHNPFKTIVIDTVTGLSESIWQHQAVVNAAALADPRKWAGNIGMKVSQLIDWFTGLPCNSVFIFHSEIDKNELTGEIRIIPSVYSKLRDFLGGKFSQFVYQEGDGTQVRVKPFGNIKGIGCRWPAFTNELIGSDFNSIYGKEPDVYK